jgi:hypothetical protein
MTTNHTPGPWQVNSNDPLHVCDADGESRGCSPIAFVQVGNDGRWTARANARLIAAAPDLLAALQHALERFEAIPAHRDEMGIYRQSAAIARAAIARATNA